MDVQRELKLTNIQELSTLPEQVGMSHTRQREDMIKTDASQKRILVDPHGKRV